MKPSLSDLQTKLRIDCENGTVFWIKLPNHSSRRGDGQAGCACTTLNGKQYWIICFNNCFLKRGHIIFLAANGHYPRPYLDHINGDSLDDRIANLREATKMQNAWNRHKRARSIDLPMGVRIHNNRFQARIGFYGRLIQLGSYETIDEARQAYLAKRKELYGEFA